MFEAVLFDLDGTFADTAPDLAAALNRLRSDLDLAPENIIVASGIGCSSRMPGFFSTYGFHGIHGRFLPLAAGIKLSQPDKTVIAVGGDGDGFGIGGGHVPHAARRNIEIGTASVNAIEIVSGLQEGDRIVISGTDEFGDAETILVSN